MKIKFSSINLLRLLLAISLAIPLALGGFSPAGATVTNTVVLWGAGSGFPEPPNMDNLIAIDAGSNFSLALRSDGTVAAWGYDDYGQTNVPAGLTGVVAISAGVKHSLALKSDGTVVTWGSNLYGENVPPAGLTDVVAIEAGLFYSLALKSDGTVVGWGYPYVADIPADLTGVEAISAGQYHALALKSDGTIVGWGSNFEGEASQPAGLTDVVAIEAGYYYSLALKSDGTVVAWGSSDYGRIDVPAGLTDVIAISSGPAHSLALKSDGTVVAWGSNEAGLIDVPPGLTGVVAISAGGLLNMVLVPNNSAPIANPGGPYLGAVNTAISFDGSGSSDTDGDPLTYSWTFGDVSIGTGATPTHAYANSGLYDVCLTVNDGTVDSESTCTLAVVYDPSAGFVTGGGWINSPAGAYKPDQSLSGQATFGFVSKYQKGASIPTGNTAFTFDMAGMAFASQSYEWLVVNQSGTNAQFKGSGTVNGLLDTDGNAYKFMLWAGDGTPDTFRIRIWYEDATGEHDVYDNGVAQAISGGNIVVHTGK